MQFVRKVTEEQEMSFIFNVNQFIVSDNKFQIFISELT